VNVPAGTLTSAPSTQLPTLGVDFGVDLGVDCGVDFGATIGVDFGSAVGGQHPCASCRFTSHLWLQSAAAS
jgi:hypothetical protein